MSLAFNTDMESSVSDFAFTKYIQKQFVSCKYYRVCINLKLHMPTARLKPLEALFVINGANYCSYLFQEITPVANSFKSDPRKNTCGQVTN